MILLQLSGYVLLILDRLPWGYLDQRLATGWRIRWICSSPQFEGHASEWLVAWGCTSPISCVDDQIITRLGVRSSLHLDLLNYHTLGRLPSINLGKVSLGFLVVIHRELDLFKISFLLLLLLRRLLMVVLNVIKHCEVLASPFLSLFGWLRFANVAASSNFPIFPLPLMICMKRRRRTRYASLDDPGACHVALDSIHINIATLNWGRRLSVDVIGAVIISAHTLFQP